LRSLSVMCPVPGVRAPTRRSRRSTPLPGCAPATGSAPPPSTCTPWPSFIARTQQLLPQAVRDARDQELTWTQIGELPGTTARLGGTPLPEQTMINLTRITGIMQGRVQVEPGRGRPAAAGPGQRQRPRRRLRRLGRGQAAGNAKPQADDRYRCHPDASHGHAPPTLPPAIALPDADGRGSGGLDRVDALHCAGLQSFGFDDLESVGVHKG